MKTLADIQKEVEQFGSYAHFGISDALYPMALYTVSSVLQIRDRSIYGQFPTYRETYRDCEYSKGGVYHSRYFRAMRPFTPYVFERRNRSWFLWNRDYVPFNPNAGLHDEHPAIEHLRQLEWNRKNENKASLFTDGIAPWCGREHLLTTLELFDQCIKLDQQYRAGAEVSA
jgi:hypothetical protein